MSRHYKTTGLTTTLVAVMLSQIAGLFIREWVSRALIDGGADPAVARLRSAWFGFAAQLILLAPIFVQQRQLLLRRLARPADLPALFIVAVAIGIAMRLASWGIAILETTIPARFNPICFTPPGKRPSFCPVFS